MHRLPVPQILILLGLAVAGLLRIGLADAASADVGTQIGRVVAGILSYARWSTPVESYHFCTVGEVIHLQDGWQSLSQEVNHPLDMRRLSGDETSWIADCNVLYIGRMASAQRSRLLAEAVGKPALTISEGDSVCAEASMFCLVVQGGKVGLLANLDAISRSGIRINPKVLQLVHRKQSGK